MTKKNTLMSAWQAYFVLKNRKKTHLTDSEAIALAMAFLRDYIPEAKW